MYSDSQGARGNRSEYSQLGAYLVDGRVVVKHSRAVGLMDVLTVGEDNYRCVLDTNGKLRYRPIAKKEAGTKLCRLQTKQQSKAVKPNTHFMMEGQ